WAIDDQYDLDKTSKLYDMVSDALTSLYEHYASFQTQNVSVPSEVVDLTSMDTDIYNERDVADYEFEKHVGAQVVLDKKTDLDKYLMDDREPNIIGKSFDPLGWWKKAEERYPIVALMARDVLAIPVSTVASESAFSTGGRILDQFRSSLSSHMAEALICGQDWLRVVNRPLIIEEVLLKWKRLRRNCPIGGATIGFRR
ncbi:hypothetical protein SOVF_027150, partial [Spinacia oleracea]